MLPGLPHHTYSEPARRTGRGTTGNAAVADRGYMSRKIRKIRTDIFQSETNRSFNSCNSCNRLVPTAGSPADSQPFT